ncbi:MAG: methyltransferase domain-containing protein [Mariniphaga sp.]|nr:methyltransferase domain-containing protein [Mariniphaga sp.]
MLSIGKQIEKGFLVCPRSKNPLFLSEDGKYLHTADQSSQYTRINGCPIILPGNSQIEEIVDRKDMPENPNNIKRTLKVFKKYLFTNFQTRTSKQAFARFDDYSDDALLLVIGGGPIRHHKNMINLNIQLIKNVDIVADAYNLPYNDNCVDAIFIDAVLEHLHNPMVAIMEMRRVLKKGGRILSMTPFLQFYHADPNHYQNLTLAGHEHYYKSCGFKIVESGVCVGPTYALIMLNMKYLSLIFPRFLNIIIPVIYGLITMIIFKPMDLVLNKKEWAHTLCSTTFVLVEKQ